MPRFYNPWKRQKTKGFQGVYKWDICVERINQTKSWKRQKTKGFLMFSEGIEMGH